MPVLHNAAHPFAGRRSYVYGQARGRQTAPGCGTQPVPNEIKIPPKTQFTTIGRLLGCSKPTGHWVGLHRELTKGAQLFPKAYTCPAGVKQLKITGCALGTIIICLASFDDSGLKPVTAKNEISPARARAGNFRFFIKDGF
jgi:hypothetical protein